MAMDTWKQEKEEVFHHFLLSGFHHHPPLQGDCRIVAWLSSPGQFYGFNNNNFEEIISTCGFSRANSSVS